MANTYGRQVVLPLTNKSGGGVIAGDVVIVDTANNDAFTTTTSAATTAIVGIAQETIASNAIGRVLLSGYAALVNTNASVTRGHYGATHTVAKQAADAGASRVAGAFCQFLTGGTTPDAMVWTTDLGAGTGSGSITASGYTQTTARLLGRTTAATGAIEEMTVGSGLSLSAGALTATGGAAGAMVWLQTQTASASAQLDFTSFISSTYLAYVFDFVNIIPATDGSSLNMRMGTGGGPTYDTGNNYSYTYWRWLGTGSGNGGATTVSAIVLALGQTASGGVWGMNGSLKLNDPAATATYKHVFGDFSTFDNAAGAYLGHASRGAYISTTAVTAVRFYASAGNLTSGSIYCYGIAHA